MPLCPITAQTGVLSNEAKTILAGELTSLHSEYSGVLKKWVHVVFQDYAAGSGFTAGQGSATAALTLQIRAGRSAEYKGGLLQRLWELLQDAAGAPNEQIVLGIQEVPPSQAMEMRQIMQEIETQDCRQWHWSGGLSTK
jgi:phenylpyruvate tautomerase PptA (4-oxalocrotonate tautomerase family)